MALFGAEDGGAGADGDLDAEAVRRRARRIDRPPRVLDAAPRDRLDERPVGGVRALVRLARRRRRLLPADELLVGLGAGRARVLRRRYHGGTPIWVSELVSTLFAFSPGPELRRGSLFGTFCFSGWS